MRRRSRRRAAAASAGHERWLVSYADFVTLLFALFTTLYAISTVDKAKANELATSVAEALNAISAKPPSGVIVPPTALIPNERAPAAVPDELSRMRALHAAADALAALPTLEGRVTVRKERDRVVIGLSEAGFFESGKASLRSDAHAALTTLATRLSAMPDTDVVVEGHTDDLPVRGGHFHSNWELSTVRATFVVSLFVAAPGFDPSRIGAAGYGEHRPIASNETEEGRAHNRRVDIVLRPASVAPASRPPTVPPAADATQHKD